MNRSCEALELRMFTIASFKRYPQSSATRRVSGGFQNNCDFSIGAYQRFDAGRPRASEAFSNSVRVLKRIAAALIERFVAAMLESRRTQIAVIMAQYGSAIDAEHKSETSRSGKPWSKEKAEVMRFESGPPSRPVRMRCVVTGAPCEGDLAHLCDDWGCARKGGLSPISHENF